MNIPKTRKKYISIMMLQALIIVIIEVVAIILTVVFKNCLPILAGLAICLVLAYILATYYYYGSSFKCPDCDIVFKPSKKDFFKSVRIRSGREFKCPSCNKKVKCKEGFIYCKEYK